MNTAVITSLIAAASAFGWLLSFEGVPDRMVEFLLGATNSKLMFLLFINLLILLLGMFLETISVMIIIVPILMPAVTSLNIDPIHFGVVVSLGTVVGLITPPVGPGPVCGHDPGGRPPKGYLFLDHPFSGGDCGLHGNHQCFPDTFHLAAVRIRFDVTGE